MTSLLAREGFRLIIVPYKFGIACIEVRIAEQIKLFCVNNVYSCEDATESSERLTMASASRA